MKFLTIGENPYVAILSLLITDNIIKLVIRRLAKSEFREMTNSFFAIIMDVALKSYPCTQFFWSSNSTNYPY